MRISLVSHVSVIVFIAVIAGLFGVNHWGGNELKKPIALQDQFVDLCGAIQTEVATPIQIYLYTSDALILNEVENNVANIVNGSLQQLPGNMVGELLPLMETLTNFIINDLRASGKLSSNLTALLDNNTSQIEGDINS